MLRSEGVRVAYPIGEVLDKVIDGYIADFELVVQPVDRVLIQNKLCHS